MDNGKASALLSEVTLVRGPGYAFPVVVDREHHEHVIEMGDPALRPRSVVDRVSMQRDSLGRRKGHWSKTRPLLRSFPSIS